LGKAVVTVGGTGTVTFTGTAGTGAFVLSGASTLTGTAAKLTGVAASGATGTVAITALETTATADLSNITANTVTAAAALNNSTITFTGNLGKAAVTLTGTNGGASDIFNVDSANMGTATFSVGADAILQGTAAKLGGVTATGTGTVQVTALGAATDLDGLNTTLAVNAAVASNIDVSANTHLGTVDSYSLANGVTLTIGNSLSNVSAISGVDGIGENLILKGASTFDMSAITFTNIDEIRATNTEVQTIIAKGANKIVLGATSAATTISYTNADQFGDTITGFVSGEDKVVFADALTSKAGTGALSLGTTTLDTSSQDGVIISKAADLAATAKLADADLTDLTKVAALITELVIITDGANATADKDVFVIESSVTTGKFGVYSWTQSANSDTGVSSDELTLIGVFTGDAVVASDFTAV
jgi:hypothetical protein